MSTIERMTVTMPAEMAAGIRNVVNAGQYASTSEVIREAVREWNAKRGIQSRELEALRADIDKGLSDLASGRVSDFEIQSIIERGRRLSSANTPSD